MKNCSTCDRYFLPLHGMFWNLERVKKIRPLYCTKNMKFSHSLTWPRYLRCFLTWLPSILPPSVTNNYLQWPLQLHTFPTKSKWLGLIKQLHITFHSYNPPSLKMWNRPKKLNAVSTKSKVFSPVCSLPYFVFTLWYLNTTWVHVMHVLDMLWVWRVCNMSLGMLCELWKIDNMTDYESQTCQGITQLFLENMNGPKGRLWDKIAAVLLYWLHSISLAYHMYNIVPITNMIGQGQLQCMFV